MQTDNYIKTNLMVHKLDPNESENINEAQLDAMQALREMIAQFETHIECMNEFWLPHYPSTKSLIDRRVAQVAKYQRILKQREQGDWLE